MTDLLRLPLWQADSLGSPLPDTEFGVSVSLPLWQHVIGYEERDPQVIEKFRSGYPRFCCPPAVTALFEKAADACAEAENQACLVFPRLTHAQRCLDFIAREGFSGLAKEWKGLGVAIFPISALTPARRYWRFCGEIISTRQACSFLRPSPATATPAEGKEASTEIIRRLAQLSGQQPEDVFLFPSGMAANFAVHRMLTHLFPGRKTAQLDFPYVDVLKLQQLFGHGAHFFPILDDEGFEELAQVMQREPLAGLFGEVPSNPLLRCADLERVLHLREEHAPELPIVLDDTISTLVHADALKVADIVTTSLTKSFSGTGDVLAGSVILSRRSPHHSAFSAYLKAHADHELWCEDAVALERNSRDFTQRVDAMSENAELLAQYLSNHPKVERVWHARQQGGPGYEFIRRPQGGYGCLFSFLLKNAETASPKFYDALRVCKGPSLGTRFTLVCPYTLLAHYDELPWALSCGVPSHLLRVSAGLEPIADLIERFRSALEAA